MRVYIFEHICGGGLSHVDLRATLARKGGAMLGALVADFVEAGAEVTASLDRRVELPLEGAGVQRVEPGADFASLFDRMARDADAALVVAPEFDRLLEGWCARLKALGVRSLSCAPEAVALCGDKLALSRHLLNAGVPTPVTEKGTGSMVRNPRSPMMPVPFPCIVKPRYGAGCEATYVCRSDEELRALPPREDWIVQPYIPGVAASAAYLVHAGQIRPLRAGQQMITGEGQLAYRGGRLPLPPELEERALALGRRALAALPEGVNGFVGVDLVLQARNGTDATDRTDETGSSTTGGGRGGDFVIEINPRPTVAFAGLRQLCRNSLAAAMLDTGAPLTWRTGRLRYDASGACHWEEQS